MFESKLKRLEEIIHAMESEDLELEKSLSLFEEGIKLTKECQAHLVQAEQKVKVLLGTDNAGNPVLKDFVAKDDV